MCYHCIWAKMAQMKRTEPANYVPSGVWVSVHDTENYQALSLKPRLILCLWPAVEAAGELRTDSHSLWWQCWGWEGLGSVGNNFLIPHTSLGQDFASPPCLQSCLSDLADNGSFSLPSIPLPWIIFVLLSCHYNQNTWQRNKQTYRSKAFFWFMASVISIPQGKEGKVDLPGEQEHEVENSSHQGKPEWNKKLETTTGPLCWKINSRDLLPTQAPPPVAPQPLQIVTKAGKEMLETWIGENASNSSHNSFSLAYYSFPSSS